VLKEDGPLRRKAEGRNEGVPGSAAASPTPPSKFVEAEVSV